MIYLDNAATTKINPVAWQAMQDTEQNNYFNANTLYLGGIHAAQAIDQARARLMQKLHASDGQMIFTNTATQANHLIMDHCLRRPEQHLVITAGDHNSVYLYAKARAERGYTVTTAPLKRDGTIDIDALQQLITDQTALFVFSLVNSDIGTYQNAAAIIATVRARNPKTHIHADAAQAFCKFDFNVTQLGLDSVTICGHKIHGPKGVAALWMRDGIKIEPPHGTLNNAAVIGLATAAENFNCPQVDTLHRYLVEHLPAGCQVNGINNNPYITNILLPNIFGETVMNALSSREIYVGLGSACASHAKGNRTLDAMKLSPKAQKQVLRVSLGMNNTLDEIKTFIDALTTVLAAIRNHDII
ncbi:MAG: aminotransferase class V-fold PLP-dependent enzyme [Eubacteriales bacterium]|nr:aminotransferase class V-fold PLP-dependent enzyme [Eubacteriales bacterium]